MDPGLLGLKIGWISKILLLRCFFQIFSIHIYGIAATFFVSGKKELHDQ